MKILVSLLAFLFLTNCYSYRGLQSNNNETTDPSKVYEITLKNKSRIIARNLRIENENYFFEDSKNRGKSVPMAMVSTIRERNFSWGKTIGLTLGVSAVTLAVTIGIALSNLRIGMGEINGPW